VCRGFQDRDGEPEGPKLVEDVVWKLKALASAGKSVNGATRRKYLEPIEAMAVPSMSHFNPEQLLELILIYGNLREKVGPLFPIPANHNLELDGGIRSHADGDRNPTFGSRLRRCARPWRRTWWSACTSMGPTGSPR
jgi:hypothetical protein